MLKKLLGIVVMCLSSYAFADTCPYDSGNSKKLTWNNTAVPGWVVVFNALHKTSSNYVYYFNGAELDTTTNTVICHYSNDASYGTDETLALIKVYPSTLSVTLAQSSSAAYNYKGWYTSDLVEQPSLTGTLLACGLFRYRQLVSKSLNTSNCLFNV